MRTTFITSALAFVVPALSAPTVIPITKRAGPVKPDSYIIQLKNGASDETWSQITQALLPSGSSITYDYRPLMPAFAAGNLKDTALTLLQRMPQVESIEQDPIVFLMEHEHAGGAPPDVVPSDALEYHNELFGRADSSGAYGSDVDIYAIDTGIYTEHLCFEGRASWGANFVGGPDTDENGHGTHTAGTAAGKKYGIATKANIVAVKVLGADGSGSNSGVIAGVNWAYQNFMKTNKSSIATMSLGSFTLPFIPTALNEAIEAAIAGGMHFTVAAGNSYLPASTSSPANIKGANTIGAVDSSNKKAAFSNWGYYIDVWAPGVDITSAWIGKPDAENTISGTSMATPYVAGILANAISKHGNKSPEEMSNDLKKHARPVVTGVLIGTKGLATQW
ncbi:unnamed protein product [Rhizoctonia solani]|uniref:Uncharacterized protein n=1 Tax=Rhizoctonia solani TaxID=456999 RepID=A0A8H3H0P2_9AGAM|nr:unnamed protein product [Rhizoctonia solani]